MSDNQTLLDWAVANIEQWDEDYTHLRGDELGVCYTVGPLWRVFEGHWGHNNGGVIHKTINDSISSTPQVIAKEEWEEAKKAKTTKSFTKADLKTGMILEFNTGALVMVLRGTTGGDIVSGHKWTYLGLLAELGTNNVEFYIVKVYQPASNKCFLNDGLHINHPVIWELDPNSEKRRELEKQVQEQQAILAELQAKLKELE